MVFFLQMYEPVFPLHFRAYVLHIAYLHFSPIFKLLHKGTAHYCKRWVLNEKKIKILSLALPCHELWCFEGTDPVFTERCSKADMNQCKECLLAKAELQCEAGANNNGIPFPAHCLTGNNSSFFWKNIMREQRGLGRYLGTFAALRFQRLDLKATFNNYLIFCS